MTDVILLDGGMGQELIARAKEPPHPFWSARVMLREPEVVRDVHAAYVAAGARVLTVNTYSVTRTRVENYGEGASFEELHMTACHLADEARAGRRDVALAGCLPPLVASYKPDLALPFEQARAEYAEIVAVESPFVDLFLAETIPSVAEGRAAAEAACPSGKPVWIAFTVKDDDGTHLRSGEPLVEAVKALADLPVAGVLVNCSLPESCDLALPALLGQGPVAGVYANGFVSIDALDAGGTVDVLKARQDLGPEAYADFALGWVNAGAGIVGGCCEVGPAHIAAIARRLETDGHRIATPGKVEPA
ncbi:MAG: homocysteine S-methyltransferase family protein [Pseudomonadota bacterium]